MRVTVHEIMNEEAAYVTAGTSFKEVAETLIRHGLNAVPVIDDGSRVIGIVSEADLLPKEEFKEQYSRESYPPPIRARLRRRLSPGGRRTMKKVGASTTAELMTAPAITIRPQHAIVYAMRLMDEHGVVCLPVVDDRGRLVGVVSRHDLVKVFLRRDEDIADEIQEELDHLAWVDTSQVEVAVKDGVVALDGRTGTRSDVSLIARRAAQVNGVVDVRDELLWDEDDA
ncbi:CBS domain-containing protein [Nonomuraea sp. NPDC050680]|uniref:CBS domain-containing protein n=1 Tax=Nonomuraea sp. NPDC050680 TaxID=3154630 RepID=UPI0033FB122A